MSLGLRVAVFQTRLCWTHTRSFHNSGNLSLGVHSPSRLHPRLILSRTFTTTKTRYSESKPNTSTPSQLPTNKLSLLSKVLPGTFSAAPTTASSLRKIVALARPEKKPLLAAIGLLFVSSSVSMSIPFTIGKLIDFFSASAPVGSLTICPVSLKTH